MVLNAFIEWGKDVLKFEGMWSFSVFDALTKNILICRDRMGVKPLYYSFQNNVFSSHQN